MDPNGHINNVAYLAWAMEVIPDHVYQQYQLSEVRGCLLFVVVLVGYFVAVSACWEHPCSGSAQQSGLWAGPELLCTSSTRSGR
jgi:hypothetical protein